jgi:lysophospholipase L1-like esterase
MAHLHLRPRAFPFLTVITALSLLALLVGCSRHQPTAVAHDSGPERSSTQEAGLLHCRAATPTLRTDGDTRKHHERIIANVARGGHEICFLGASIMERWETVGKDPWNAVWLPRHAVDCGIGGDRTQHVLARLDNGLLDALAAPNNHIKWVVMNIGSNNTDEDTGAEIAAGTEAIIARLHDHLPNAQIALVFLFPRGQWPNPLRDTISSSIAHLKPFVARHPQYIHAIDIGNKFLRPTGEIPPELMPDFLHPSAVGYQIFSDELAKAIK